MFSLPKTVQMLDRRVPLAERFKRIGSRLLHTMTGIDTAVAWMEIDVAFSTISPHKSVAIWQPQAGR
jgi:hypothetical protein